MMMACWNADDIHGRKLELEHFLSDHSIYALSEKNLEPGGALRFANYICHRTDRPTRGGGKEILVRSGIDNYAVPVSGLQHLGTAAIHVVLTNRPVKFVATYVSPTRLLIKSELTECLSGFSSVLMGGDLNAKHRDWNCRLTTSRGSLLCDYANRNSSLVYGTDSPTTNPYNSNATPNVLDIVIVKDFVLPVHLTVCQALSSDHHLSSPTQYVEHLFTTHRTTPTSREWTGPASLEAGLPGNPAVNDKEGINKFFEKVTSAIKAALAASAPRSRLCADWRPPLLAGIHDKIRPKNRLRRQ
jgi:hypothetical protein